MTYTFELPIAVILPRKTGADVNKALNLNGYRNWHYQISNQVKTHFMPVIVEPFKAKRIRISYTVTKRRKARYDTMNIVTIVDKFFCDWLVAQGMIPDDSCENVELGGAVGGYGDFDRCVAVVEKLS